MTDENPYRSPDAPPVESARSSADEIKFDWFGAFTITAFWALVSGASFGAALSYVLWLFRRERSSWSR